MTISESRVLKEKYEVHHGVRIKDSAIVAAATLSKDEETSLSPCVLDRDAHELLDQLAKDDLA